jgi:cholesterol transport system auxiliary component
MIRLHTAPGRFSRLTSPQGMLRLSPLLFLVVLISLPTSCSFRRAYPVRHTFLLEAHRPGEPWTKDATLAILRVRPATVVPPFDESGFVYRDGELLYETDYYNQFLVPPRTLLGQATRQWLDRSGLFHAVLDPSSRVSPTHTLETSLTELYGDYRNPSAPEAVLGMHFHLLQETPAGPQIQFHRAYRETEPLAEAGAPGLAKAWSRALERILTAFEADLAGLLLGLPPESPP